MVTLKDIAQACGVSVASVSKALNNATDIGADTAEKIRKTARDLGYYPNAAARSLKTNRTYNIGVIFEDDTDAGLAHEYFSEILEAVKTSVEAKGFDVTFISKHIGEARMSFLEHCRYRNVDGVVIVCADFKDPSVAELVSSNIPMVTIDYVFDNVSSVVSDNVLGMRELTKYIISMGHRKIAFIHGEDTAVTKSRLASFYNVCEENGIEVPEEYIKDGRYHDPASAGASTRELLKLKDMPTCIIYPDDISLLGGVSEIERQGIRLITDISIAGYDGISLSQMLRPRITTLHQDSKTLGVKAAELLLKQIESPKSFIPRSIYVPGTVYPGNSVARLTL